MPIGELADKMATDPEIGRKAKSSSNSVIEGHGGLPMRVGEELTCAIGVGGGHGGTIDEGCARACVDAMFMTRASLAG
jgi:uncharacterized protein GlcG (DUF336 family)